MSSQSATLDAPAPVQTGKDRIINDFAINVATVNGSGSASSNTVLFRSIFRMGIPVRSVNLFPSNIQGLPTWFVVRASKDGYIGHRTDYAYNVLMNPDTMVDDLKNALPGSVVISDTAAKLAEKRSDVIHYPVPFKQLVEQACDVIKLRKLVTNIIYDGILAHLLNIPMELIHESIDKQWGGKKSAVSLNQKAAQVGFEWAQANLAKVDPWSLEKMDKTTGKIIVEGNEAGALGAMFGGCSVMTWYPITPSSSLCESFIKFASKYRKDENGKATFASIQMEDELASIGGVLGAGWAGARAMTATAGPGISLMAEFTGLGYFTETPAVIWNVQRVGPSTGLPTRTSQGDLSFTYTLSHGDTQHPMLLPNGPNECFTFAALAFDLAEQLQTPVFVLSDLDIGMNKWMADPFEDVPPFKRGKVLTKEDLDAKAGQWGRYKDYDGDAIPYRTLPGTDHMHAAWFARGSGHDEYARYTESPAEYKNLMDRLRRKLETARAMVPESVIHTDQAGAKIGIIAYGSSDWAVLETRERLKKAGVACDYLRVRGLPFRHDVIEFVASHDVVYLVEQNRDGQMADILKNELEAKEAGKIVKILHYDGIPLDAQSVLDMIQSHQKGA